MADGKRILVIEDSLLLCHILEKELLLAGFEVIISHDGKGGLLKAQVCEPDVILLDLTLPDIPGEEVCRELKKHSDTEHTPVIMLSGKDSDVDRIVGRVLGAHSYISKPFAFNHLMAEIKRLLAMVFLIFGVLCNSSLFAADGNETQQAPAGMELIKVGEHSVYVAQGTKVTQRGSQLILEPPDEFVARKILFLEEEIAALKDRQLQMLQQIENLAKEVERLSPLVSTEAGNGSK